MIATVNLWNGINITNSKTEIIFHILTMINIGFIEEIIFRGFLFKMMEKQGSEGAHPGVLLEYYIKKHILFAIKCQKALAICAKAVYNDSAIL